MASVESRRKAVVFLKASKGSDDPYAVVSKAEIYSSYISKVALFSLTNQL